MNLDIIWDLRFGICYFLFRYAEKMEAAIGFEPMVKVLQTSALATWLRRRMFVMGQEF